MVEQSVDPSNRLRSASMESSRERFVCPVVDGHLIVTDNAVHPVTAVVPDCDMGATVRLPVGAGV